ncbi:3-methyl-2-oxobutanoate hydroxymethyltransferase [Kocuria sp. LUK]|uniref:3-methyl-2-oxobutanoate hydroxymethyltransferase n=1 Tax=Kocuria flava TaxID=446860 RepID=A0A2N4T442_9MICC|nr:MULTISPECIES: 3-methyl-2-oxobutanoate hydroxymethyltransferase [Kocuria]MCD1144109.1 3-methyl-2-oxobutanoate hydroxymethyltransferase [Kocuria sp. LUK]PLC12994.1 3-methyl-2-oxobutanoate hydroxymethyltransferase [Kocuria flava]
MTQQPQDGPRPATGALDVRRVRTHHLREAKRRGERFAMLTCYDALTAAVFDAAGVDVLLVGDSAGNTVLGHATTLPVTVGELLPLCRAVAGAAQRALVVVDLPFGSYEASPEQAVGTAVRFLKEGGAHAVKVEGGAWFAPHVRAMTQAGVPVVAHIGFTPQSEHALGGYRVQGRGEAGRALVEDARALEEAGAFAVLMEMVPAEAAAAVDAAVQVPTVGIGAGATTTGQVLVWQDMLGLRQGRMPRFVRRYADLHGVVTEAVGRYVEDVREGRFPAPEHGF